MKCSYWYWFVQCHSILHLTIVFLFQAYKYVPFGKVDEVIPYLIRRAQENSDVLGGVGTELAMLKKELARRLNPLSH